MDRTSEILENELIKLFEMVLPSEKLTLDFKNYIAQIAIFRTQLSSESDRGCALYAGSYLESLLSKFLRKKLIGSDKHLDEILSFNGAVGSFSNKIKICYSVGLISEEVKNDLNVIRKIRNEFGHSPNIINFEDNKISDLCNNLKLIARQDVLTSRNKFITSIHYIIGKLEVETIQAEKFNEKIDTNDLQKTTDIVSKFVDLYKIIR